LRPNWVEALNNLAWHLATQPNRDLRNGAEALELSQRAADLTKHQDPEVLDTLAAAYAEVGQYRAAAETVRKALALAQASGQSNLLAGLQEQLSRYLSANENSKK
jgi:tetratricopeptide (TPR) repeat protein